MEATNPTLFDILSELVAMAPPKMVMIVAMVMQPQSVKSFLSLKAAKYLRALALIRRLLLATGSRGVPQR